MEDFKKTLSEILSKLFKILKLVLLTILVLPAIFIVDNLKSKWEKLMKEFIDYGY